MAKKKSRKVPVKKPMRKLDKVFDCPFCNHSNCIEIKLDREKKVGSLQCRICKTRFQSKINHLSAEVDVFCEWIDECHEINKGGGKDVEVAPGGDDDYGEEN
jgi:transcription elongation factor Elf1